MPRCDCNDFKLKKIGTNLVECKEMSHVFYTKRSRWGLFPKVVFELSLAGVCASTMEGWVLWSGVHVLGFERGLEV